MACSVIVIFDERQVFVREMHVEGLDGDEVQLVATKLMEQIILQVEAIAIVNQMGEVIENDNSVGEKAREEIIGKLEELKQVLVVREPKWKAARELLAFAADIASVAPLVGYLQQLLPLLRV